MGRRVRHGRAQVNSGSGNRDDAMQRSGEMETRKVQGIEVAASAAFTRTVSKERRVTMSIARCCC